jgi:hypothetical protein
MYRIGGIDVHKKKLAVVVTDVEVHGEYQFERCWFGANPEQLRLFIAMAGGAPSRGSGRGSGQPALRLFTQSTQSGTDLRRDVFGTAEHNFVLKMVGISCRHTEEDIPVLDRDSPLPHLKDLPQLSLWPT